MNGRSEHHDDDATLGELVRRHRRQEGLTQAQAAVALGVNQATVAKWERGDLPSPDRAATLAEFLGWDPEAVVLRYHRERAGRDGAHDRAPRVAPSSSDLEDPEPLPPGPVDHARIERAVREILLAIGEDPDREGLRGTPSRVARMYAEVCSGLHTSARDHLQVTFDARHDEMVMVRDIPLASLCEHHLVPFVGKAHVAYIPGAHGRITGLSKLARLVEVHARRPQVQERMTEAVADELEAALDPRGVLVVVEAEHLCMSMRGVRIPGATTVTSAVRGLFRENAATRGEAMQFIHRSRG